MKLRAIRALASLGLLLQLLLLAAVCCSGVAAAAGRVSPRAAFEQARAQRAEASLQPEADALVQLQAKAAVVAHPMTIDEVATAFRTALSMPTVPRSAPPSFEAVIAGLDYRTPTSPFYAARAAEVNRLTTQKNTALQTAVPSARAGIVSKYQTDVKNTFLKPQQAVDYIRTLPKCILGTSPAPPNRVTNGFTFVRDRCYRTTRAYGPVTAVPGSSSPGGDASAIVDLLYFIDQNQKRPTSDNHLPDDFDAGHMIGAEVGGAWTNTDVRNFFPQRRSSNGPGGVYYHAERAAAALKAQKPGQGNTVEIDITYVYPYVVGGMSNPKGSMMPSKGTYTIRWDGAHHNEALLQATHPVLNNPKLDANGRAGWKQVVLAWIN